MSRRASRWALHTTNEREGKAALRKDNVQLKQTNEGCGRRRLFQGTARSDPAQVARLLDEHPYPGDEPLLRELHVPFTTYYRDTEKIAAQL